MGGDGSLCGGGGRAVGLLLSLRQIKCMSASAEIGDIRGEIRPLTKSCFFVLIVITGSLNLLKCSL